MFFKNVYRVYFLVPALMMNGLPFKENRLLHWIEEHITLHLFIGSIISFCLSTLNSGGCNISGGLREPLLLTVCSCKQPATIHSLHMHKTIQVTRVRLVICIYLVLACPHFQMLPWTTVYIVNIKNQP